MHPAYFTTRFRLDSLPPQWPTQFSIISAHATTGQTWPTNRNVAADRKLSNELSKLNVWHHRIIGYSPETGHAEPSWACHLPLEQACELGRLYHQDAIYFVESDELYVTHCDHRRTLHPVGAFRQRIDGMSQP